MSLLETLKKDQMDARRAKDGVTVTLLSTLIGEAVKVGKDAANRDSTDDEVIRTIKKFINNCEDTRTHLVAFSGDTGHLDRELALYNRYVPKQLSEQALEVIILTMKQTSDTFDMKNIMAALKSQYAGTYDGKLASAVANRILKG